MAFFIKYVKSNAVFWAAIITQLIIIYLWYIDLMPYLWLNLVGCSIVIFISIIIQLMGMAVPAVQKMQKDGESGRRKLNQITRYLTILIAGVQAPSYLANLSAQGVVLTLDPATFWFLAWVTLTTGTIFAMWLGERITDKGIGNGISLLIMVGIIATLPQAFFQEMLSQVNQGAGWVAFIIELFVLFVITMFAIALLLLPIDFFFSNSLISPSIFILSI